MCTVLLVAGRLIQAQAAIEPLPRSSSAASTVKSFRITILSTMLADRGVGEWGFAALIEADGHRFLYDAGYRPETVLANARALGIDLTTVTDVILSHHHGDHTGGLVALRRELAKTNPASIRWPWPDRRRTRRHSAQSYLKRREPRDG